MAVEKVPTGASFIEVLEWVLDKGIVVDQWVHISLTRIDLTGNEGWIRKPFSQPSALARLLLLIILLLVIAGLVKWFSAL